MRVGVADPPADLGEADFAAPAQAAHGLQRHAECGGGLLFAVELWDARRLGHRLALSAA
jgi:hypothetical protein